MRGGRYLLGGILALTCAATLPRVLLERRPMEADEWGSYLSIHALRQAVIPDSGQGFREFSRSIGYRGFIIPVVSLPLALGWPNPVVGARLTQVLLLLFCVWLVQRLARRLGGSPRAGLLAAFLLASFPPLLGYGPLLMGDASIMAASLLLFRLALSLDLRRPWTAAGLGLGIGLCAGTRLLLLVYVAGLGVYLLAFWIRSRRSLLLSLAAGVWALACCGWWLLLQWPLIKANLFGSMDSLGPVPAVDEFSSLLRLPYLGFAWALASAALAFGLALRHGYLQRRRLWLLGCWIAVPALQFGLVWSTWERYALPLVPQCALLVALVADRAAAGLNPRRRRLLLGAPAVAAGVALALSWSVAPGLAGQPLTPKTARHDGLQRVLAPVPAGAPVVVVQELRNLDYAFVMHQTLNLSERQIYLPGSQRSWELVRAGTSVRHLLRILPRCHHPGQAICRDLYLPDPRFARLAETRGLKLLGRARDPNHIHFELYALSRPLRLDRMPDLAERTVLLK